jgi:hypothetical protein
VQSLQDHDEPKVIPALFRVINRYVGNFAAKPGVFPDYPAPVVRNVGLSANGCARYSETTLPSLTVGFPTDCVESRQRSHVGAKLNQTSAERHGGCR